MKENEGERTGEEEKYVRRDKGQTKEQEEAKKEMKDCEMKRI